MYCSHKGAEDIDGVCGCEGCVEKEEKEEFEITLSNACGEPNAVMIESEDAFIAYAAMMRAGGFGSCTG